MSETTAPTILRENIQDKRQNKELGRLFNIDLRGHEIKFSKIFDETISPILDDLEGQNSDWIAREYEKRRDYLQGETLEVVKQVHQEGFRKFMKMQYRLFKKAGTSNISRISDPKFISDSLTSYTFDFARSLSLSQRMGLTAQNALDIAEASYRVDPNALVELKLKYPNVGIAVLTRAVANYGKDPDAYVNRYIENIISLTAEFDDLPKSVLIRAATISKKPREYVLGYIERSAKIKDKYPDIPQEILMMASFRITKNPVEYAGTVLNNLHLLSVKYPLVPITVLKKAVLGFADPEEFVENVIRAVKDLGMKYPDINKEIIGLAAMSRKNPEKKLKSILAEIERLKVKFPGVDDSIISRAATHSATVPDEFIIRTSMETDRLIEKYPDLTKGIIIYIVTYKNNPEKHLEKGKTELDIYKEEYPQIDRAALEFLVFKNKSTKESIRHFVQKVESLSVQFPELTPKKIAYVIIRYSEPELYLRSWLARQSGDSVEEESDTDMIIDEEDGYEQPEEAD